jgi:hypothetical protein
MPKDYLYYFKFRGDAINYGSLSSSVPSVLTASFSSFLGTGSNSINPNSTVGGKTCLAMTASGDYVYFPAFGATSNTPPPLNFSFGFWLYYPSGMANESNAIGDKTFRGNDVAIMWHGDIYDTGLSTPIAAPSVWSFALDGYYNGPNLWVHLFYTAENATTFKVYVNGGIAKTVTTGSGSFKVLTEYYHILGRAGDTSARYFIGCGMREFLHYNRTLNASEVMAIYRETA